MDLPQEGEDAVSGNQTARAACAVSSHESLKDEESVTDGHQGVSKGQVLHSAGLDDVKQLAGQDEQTNKMMPVENQPFSPGLAGGSGDINMNVAAHSGGMVNAPAFTGCTIIGNITVAPGAMPQQRTEHVAEHTVQPQKMTTQIEVEKKRETNRQLKQHLQSILKKRCFLVRQELGDEKLQDIYTDLCVVEGRSGEVNSAHEVSTIHLKQIETRTFAGTKNKVKLSNIFSDHFYADEPVTKVLTMGIAGVGKSVAVQKFVLDWAEDIENKKIELTFVLPFRELNLYKDEVHSLFDLLVKFYPDLEDLTESTDLKEATVLFVLDGLDESRLELNFSKHICDPKEKASVAMLTTSLITGKLVPSALIWVTTRPAAANKDLCDLFDLVTEIQGFSESHREEYFKKVIPEKAEQIIAHVKSKRSLYIMCHIPVFCRITAVVLGGKGKEKRVSDQEMPKTLTEMYAQFSVFQITRMKKYQEMSPEEKGELLVKLGKLAFKHLDEGTLIFYEKDLKECEIDVNTGALQAGLCTQIFKKESAISGKSIFSFVHLSVQEFLAALYLLHTHAIDKANLFIKTTWEKTRWMVKNTRFDLYKMSLERALLSKNGRLDLCVRFLLGLAPMLEPEVRFPLNDVLPHLGVRQLSIKKTVEYIKKKISKNIPPERMINLFHCLNELGDDSLVKEINRYMSSAGEEKKLTPAQCSALTYLLLMSAEELEEFDLKKYLRSEEGLHRMLPVVNVSRRVWLNQCHLSKASCEMMASVLQRTPSHLIELDMSDNDLQDEGVELLCVGLRESQCKLETLRLSGCQISQKSCSFLSSALKSNPSFLKQLDLSYNHPGDSGVRELTERLDDPNCKLETFRFVGCKLRDKSCEIVASVLQSSNTLMELDLSHNNLGNSGVQLLSKGLSSPHCKLQTLRLSKCEISDEGYVCLAFTLMSNPACVKDLDVSNNRPGDSAQKLLSATLEDPHRKVEAIQLNQCHLSKVSCEMMASVLQRTPSHVRELDMSDNDLQDEGVELLCVGLRDPQCKLERLRFVGCKLRDKSCEIVASVLQSSNTLMELDLSHNNLGNSGVQLLSKGLSSPHCKLQTLRLSKCEISDEGYVCLAFTLMSNPACVKDLDVSNNRPGESTQKLLSATLEDPHRKVEAIQLNQCHLSKVSCEMMASVLQRTPSHVRELDMSDNDLQDEGVELLCVGLRDPQCELERLRFVGCKLRDKSCEIVASVLQSSNTLMELDLSHNNLGNSGVQLLSKGLSSPHCKLQTLRLSKCEISDEGYVCLAFTLMSNPACVKDLDVSNNRPGESTQKLLSATLEDPHRKVEAIQLNQCRLSKANCEMMASVLQRTPSHVRELDMSDNDLQDEGVKLLSVGLRDPKCKLETLRFVGCKLRDKSCEIVASVLQSSNTLMELGLSHNNLGNSGVQLLSKGLSSPHCKLQTLRLSKCEISDEGYVCLAFTLMSNPACVKDLDVSNNRPGESTQKLLSATLEDPHRKVEAIQLNQCRLSKVSCEMMASVLQRTPSHVRELDMSDNDLQDEGVELLCAGLRDPQCKLETLRFVGCKLRDTSCEIVASVLQSSNSLMELDLSNNNLGDSGGQLISKGLSSPHCKLQTLRLNQCHLSKVSCEMMASVLQRTPSHLRELDMSDNDLQDEGVKLLCVGLRDPQCKLETLRLSLCQITQKGCSLLSSALKSNPSYLKQLDLSYNHPGDAGVRELTERLNDPDCKLEAFRYDYGGEFRIKPGPRKYACELTLDPNTASRKLSLSEGNRKVTCGSQQQQPYPDHPERFDSFLQVLCREGLSGRCYWEAEWSGGEVLIAVAYKSTPRTGSGLSSLFGWNAKSWSLYCRSNSYSAWHNNKETAIPAPSSRSSRVGVYLDWPAGTLSFYSVSSNTLTHLHTFHSTFTEPLYPGFYVGYTCSVSLCQIT
ncbi:protein NLRC5-like [Sardina pilchardus]|uniref:protein NLRC5-like n=1 Tax=Sardina pilchardus TaxID=27697 RepID=UPI002E159A57